MTIEEFIRRLVLYYKEDAESGTVRELAIWLSERRSVNLEILFTRILQAHYGFPKISNVAEIIRDIPIRTLSLTEPSLTEEQRQKNLATLISSLDGLAAKTRLP